jgi:hypothetical protein
MLKGRRSEAVLAAHVSWLVFVLLVAGSLDISTEVDVFSGLRAQCPRQNKGK